MQEATCQYLRTTTTGMIIVDGKTDANRDLQIWIPEALVDQLRKIFEAEKVTGHLGHAGWHVDNPEVPLPCLSCTRQLK
jgi:hypothetical protein